MISHNNQECKAFAISLISAREYQEDDNKNNSCNSAKQFEQYDIQQEIFPQNTEGFRIKKTYSKI